MHRLDRTSASGKIKTEGCVSLLRAAGARCLNVKEVSSFCSPALEYLMITCRPYYLPIVYLYFSWQSIYHHSLVLTLFFVLHVFCSVRAESKMMIWVAALQNMLFVLFLVRYIVEIIIILCIVIFM
jgi:hypothetical protein